MMELPVTNDGNDSAANIKTEEQGNQRTGTPSTETAAVVVAAATAATSETTTAEIPSIAFEGSGKIPPISLLSSPSSGKRDHNGTSVGIMGGQRAKRGKREWLSFRGTRHTRVGKEYQVASLPPVGTKSLLDKTTESERGN